MTAIPFDTVFSFSAEQLKTSYLVNLRHLLGSAKSTEKQIEPETEAEAETEAEESSNEAETALDHENENDKMSDIDGPKASAKKQRGGKKKIKRREVEYDLDDPFIDDSEMNGVYRSVFDLMGGEGGDYYDDEEEDEGIEEQEKDAEEAGKENTANSTSNSKANVKQPSFFVYRGPLSNEVLAKEFDIVESEEESEEASQLSDSEKKGSKKQRSQKSTSASKKSSKKVAKPTKPAKKPKEPKPAKEPRQKKPKAEKPVATEKAKPEKATEMLQQATRRFGDDLFSTDEGGVASRPAEPAPKLPLSALGDANLMELRECLHRFKTAATSTPFSPGKFPTALRSLLNESVCAVLRACKPTAMEPLPEAFCPALASFLPFSVPALKKLLQKKILKSLKESIEGSQTLGKMYEMWPKLVIQRLTEENSITGAIESTTATTDESPAKKPRLKFTDEMRQLLFDVMRAEIDANNLACACNFLSMSETATDDSASLNEQFKVQSELNLRKSVYSKLASISGLPIGLITTSDLSREFGAHKRKHDKKLAKVAAEIFFGEEAIELLLKPKVVEVVNIEEGPEAAPVENNPLMNLFDEPVNNNTAMEE